MSKKSGSKAVDIKISTVVAISAVLQQTEIAQLDQAMFDLTGGVPDFFEDELAVLDLAAIEPIAESIDWRALAELFKKYRLHAVAVRNAPPAMEATILAQGLALDRQTARPKTVPTPPPAVVQAVAAPVYAPAAGTMIIDTPVRAGQRIYARGSDLIITAAVNNGAEVIADGSIHIYAPLRGRALAGASGNTEARIFTALMAAELVSIAGVYRTFDAGYPEDLGHRPVQIRLVGDRLDVHCVGA